MCMWSYSHGRGGVRTIPFCIRRPYQKEPQNCKAAGNSAAHFLPVVFHSHKHPKNKGEILFCLLSSIQKKIHLFCMLHVSVVYQALARTGMKYSDKITNNNMYFLLQMHSFASRPQGS